MILAITINTRIQVGHNATHSAPAEISSHDGQGDCRIFGKFTGRLGPAHIPTGLQNRNVELGVFILPKVNVLILFLLVQICGVVCKRLTDFERLRPPPNHLSRRPFVYDSVRSGDFMMFCNNNTTASSCTSLIILHRLSTDLKIVLPPSKRMLSPAIAV